jgi:L-amino acid N-acyltransferase YncA
MASAFETVREIHDRALLVTIRDATDCDLPAIVAIYNAAIPGRMATADTELVTVGSRNDWFHEHDPKARPLWVALENNDIVGWLSFQSFYGRPAYHATAELSVYVAADCQRKGIGSALLAKAVAHAPRLGLKTLLGFIFAHNDASVRLFEKFRFQRWGVLPQVAEFDGIERDLVIVGLRLT